MKVEMREVEKLTPYANNPRKNDKAVDAVAASIREFGFKVPITVDANGVIVTGHTRLKAAIRLRLKEVPVIVLNDLTADQVKAFRLADNKVGEISEWDFDALAIELQDIKMDMAQFEFDIPGVTLQAEEDNFEVKLPKVPKAVYGEIYKLGKHRIMCGDATVSADVEKLMDMDLADIYISDPPYNVALGMDETVEEAKARKRRTDGLTVKNDKQSEDDFLAFLIKAFSSVNSVLKVGGVFYVWHADSEGYNFRTATKRVGWQVRQCLIWNKNRMVMGRQDYQWKHEPCLYGWKSGAAHYFIDDRTFTTVIEDRINVEKLKLSEAKELIKKLLSPKVPSTIIEEDRPSKSDDHPTMKPVRLMSRLIVNSSKPGDIILDTFGGSGTTLIAAEQLNRRCYMLELDPRYVDVIIERYEKLTGDKAVKLN